MSRVRDWLLHQTCPSRGMYLVKLATLLTLLGGVGHTDRTGMRVRGESHMLLVGDAGVGKSQVLRYAAKLSLAPCSPLELDRQPPASHAPPSRTRAASGC